jgi:DNA-binding MarR family transcriptional regulator
MRRLRAPRGPARRANGSGPGAYTPPLTVSHRALLAGGGDRDFRRLLYDFLTVTDRMRALREHLARRVDLTGPQYTLLMAIANLQGDEGVQLRELATYMRVSRAFITAETAKLVAKGLIAKGAHPRDGRGAVVYLTAHGRRALDRLVPEVRAINDQFFAGLTRTGFRQTRELLDLLLAGSRVALAQAAGAHLQPESGRGGRRLIMR